MNEFRLFVLGDTFDVDRYLRETKLKTTTVWRRGVPDVDSGPRTNGFDVVLGDGFKISIDDQQAIAIQFIESHREALCLLATIPGVEAFKLGLHYHFEDESIGVCMTPTRRLMLRALEIGFEPTFYVTAGPSVSRRVSLGRKRPAKDEMTNPVLAATAVVFDEPADSEHSWAIEQLITTRLMGAVEDAFADVLTARPTRTVSFRSLNSKEANCGRCARCGCWMTDRTRKGELSGLPSGRIVDGALLCDQCESWQQS